MAIRPCGWTFLPGDLPDQEFILSTVMFRAFVFVLIPVNESPSAQRINE